ncbi:2Fe-2S iron-sulfur cluster binding domain-containing protein [Pontibacter sp. JH31]|uniref:2Fe-2S iron-sulfur cluster binding domain-containing protein n=1 Tax=Pontibacter aquaedesilientis TaxID=2766980 RepID=A0ABR7XHI5_9BACT|nr:2Fe-2S iron-sulfur cluster-binding protein [Pontibacter aquaedesilientis]MBD1397758.1 2Fe-2S iron-sulfur cluster binding domain-containing protein [Pontibacter aquaedesilientis]
MEEMINLQVELPDGSRVTLEAPTDMGLSVMEVLKANELEVPAICGGMAICATCHVEVLQSGELPELGDDEAYMLETLPHATATSRLSCQLRVTPALDGLVVRLMPEA